MSLLLDTLNLRGSWGYREEAGSQREGDAQANQRVINHCRHASW